MPNSTDLPIDVVRSRRTKRWLCIGMAITVSLIVISMSAVWWAGRSTIRRIEAAEGRYSWSKSDRYAGYLPSAIMFGRHNSPAAHIALDSDLSYVSVNGPNADDELMSHLSRLPKMKGLVISGCPMTEAALAELAGAQSLQRLHLVELTSITDVGLTRLSTHALYQLSIIRTPSFNGRGLSGLTSLVKLSVSGCARFDDSSLRQLSGFHRLDSLTIEGTSVTNDGMEHLAQFPSLEKLNLAGTAVDDTGLATIVRTCPQLKEISVIDTSITDVGFSQLAELRSLKEVYITSGTASLQAIATFKASRPGVSVHEQ